MVAFLKDKITPDGKLLTKRGVEKVKLGLSRFRKLYR